MPPTTTNDLEAMSARLCVNRSDNEQMVEALIAGTVKLREEVEKLAAFKVWVHNYLDTKGIPANPGGPHTAEGCRIGDRMDYVFAEIKRLEIEWIGIQHRRDELRDEIKRLSAPRSSDWVLPPFDSPEKLPVEGAVVEYYHDRAEEYLELGRWTEDRFRTGGWARGATRILRWRYATPPSTLTSAVAEAARNLIEIPKPFVWTNPNVSDDEIANRISAIADNLEAVAQGEQPVAPGGPPAFHDPASQHEFQESESKPYDLAWLNGSVRRIADWVNKFSGRTTIECDWEFIGRVIREEFIRHSLACDAAMKSDKSLVERVDAALDEFSRDGRDDTSVRPYILKHLTGCSLPVVPVCKTCHGTGSVDAPDPASGRTTGEWIKPCPDCGNKPAVPVGGDTGWIDAAKSLCQAAKNVLPWRYPMSSPSGNHALSLLSGAVVKFELMGEHMPPTTPATPAVDDRERAAQVNERWAAESGTETSSLLLKAAAEIRKLPPVGSAGKRSEKRWIVLQYDDRHANPWKPGFVYEVEQIKPLSGAYVCVPCMVTWSDPPAPSQTQPEPIPEGVYWDVAANCFRSPQGYGTIRSGDFWDKWHSRASEFPTMPPEREAFDTDKLRWTAALLENEVYVKYVKRAADRIEQLEAELAAKGDAKS